MRIQWSESQWRLTRIVASRRSYKSSIGRVNYEWNIRPSRLCHVRSRRPFIWRAITIYSPFFLWFGEYFRMPLWNTKCKCECREEIVQKAHPSLADIIFSIHNFFNSNAEGPRNNTTINWNACLFSTHRFAVTEKFVVSLESNDAFG